jgi:hypothetical protein
LYPGAQPGGTVLSKVGERGRAVGAVQQERARDVDGLRAAWRRRHPEVRVIPVSIGASTASVIADPPVDPLCWNVPEYCSWCTNGGPASARKDPGVIYIDGTMSGVPPVPLELQVDLSLHGNSSDIRTRVPRSVYGRLRVGDIVTVVYDSVEGHLFRVVRLTQGDRNVQLPALPAASLDERPQAEGHDA